MISKILKSPHYVISFFVIVIMLGIYVSLKLPVQLLPDIGEDRIVVGNFWPGASPSEMEREIVEPVEELLSKVPGILRYETDIGSGFAWINMTFEPGTEMQETYIAVIDRMGQFTNRPRTALEPVIINKSKDNKGSIAGIVLSPTDTNTPLDRAQYSDIFEKHIRSTLLAIPGISKLTPKGSNEKRIDVVFSPAKLAAYELEIEDLTQILGNSIDLSAGTVEQGARTFAVRFKGRRQIEDLIDLTIAKRAGKVIKLSDVAKITTSFISDDSPLYWEHQLSYYISVFSSENSNTLLALASLKEIIEQLNDEVLSAYDMRLDITKDNSTTINQAINMVLMNLIIGVILSTAILFLFIRSFPLVIVIFVSLPISIFATFVAMQYFGRSFNIISLAGIALSTGMILDAAIVVVETTVRYKQQGKAILASIELSLKEVSGALINSVVSSIIVFTPIALMQSSEGQLFHDLAITISSALAASLVVAMFLLPVLLRVVLRKVKINQVDKPFMQSAAKKLAHIMVLKKYRTIAIVTLLFVPLIGIYIVAPHADVLPSVEGTRVGVSVNVDQNLNYSVIAKEVLEPINRKVKVHQESGKAPFIKKYLSHVTGTSSVSLLFYPENPDDVEQLKTWTQETLFLGMPQLNTYSYINSLLGFGLSTSRRVTVDFTGNNLPQLQSIGRKITDHLNEKMPGINPWSNTPLNNDDPQIIFTPKDAQLIDLKENHQSLANKILSLTDGLYIGEYSNGNKSIPMYIKGNEWSQLNDVLDAPFFYPELKKPVPLKALINFDVNMGPSGLYRLNGYRTLSVNVTPPSNVPLAAFIDELKVEIQPILNNVLTPEVTVSYRGSASKLNNLLIEMAIQFCFAMFILYLLVSGLFKSFKDGAAVIMAMPIALFGGMLSLAVANLFVFQPMDVISMMGFIILIGLVINNAILFIGKYRQSQSQGLTSYLCLQETIGQRARPIYMSTLTSIFGMLPLALIPGVGSEIYRGLAIVIVGGMTFSALFSLPLMGAIMGSHWFSKSSQTLSEETTIEALVKPNFQQAS